MGYVLFIAKLVFLGGWLRGIFPCGCEFVYREDIFVWRVLLL